eukprot:SAG31_NODE_6590_length_1960_cov_2.277270_1_plen_73_part_10
MTELSRPFNLPNKLSRAASVNAALCKLEPKGSAAESVCASCSGAVLSLVVTRATSKSGGSTVGVVVACDVALM